MTVWIVYSYSLEGGTGNWIDGVFDSEQKAMDFLKSKLEVYDGNKYEYRSFTIK